MIFRCAVLDDYQSASAGFGDWSRLEGRVRVDRLTRPIAGVEELEAYDIIVAMRERTPFPAEVLARLPNLKLLITTAPRNASFDVAAARANGVTVCGTRGSFGSAAELTWALLMATTRRLPEEIANFRAGGERWQASVGSDLNGKTLGIAGIGRLGSMVARYGLAFGMDVAGWSRSNTPEASAKLGIRHAASLDELLQHSDVVTLHMPANAGTHHIINAGTIARMKPGAILVNTSRGALVDEAALIEALESGHLAAAALDVFNEEPLRSDHPFRTMPNVIATPHIGYVTAETYRVYFEDAEDIERWLAGEPVRVIE